VIIANRAESELTCEQNGFDGRANELVLTTLERASGRRHALHPDRVYLVNMPNISKFPTGLLPYCKWQSEGKNRD
jgi:hypothetical protein